MKKKPPRSIGNKPRAETQRKIQLVWAFYKEFPRPIFKPTLENVSKQVDCSTVYAHRIVHHLISKGRMVKTKYGFTAL